MDGKEGSETRPTFDDRVVGIFLWFLPILIVVGVVFMFGAIRYFTIGVFWPLPGLWALMIILGAMAVTWFIKKIYGLFSRDDD